MNRFAGDDVSIVVAVTGTVTYTVEGTLSELLRADRSANPTIVDHATLVDATESASGNFDFPVKGIRINVTAGTGSVTMQLIQGSQ